MALEHFHYNGTRYVVGDVAYFESGRTDHPWIGEIQRIYRPRPRALIHIMVRWFMRPGDVKVLGEGSAVQFQDRELFYSTQLQDNEIQWVRGKCRVFAVDASPYTVPPLGQNEYFYRYVYNPEVQEIFRRITIPVTPPRRAHVISRVESNRKRARTNEKQTENMSVVKLLQNMFAQIYQIHPTPSVPWRGHEVFYSTVALWLRYLFVRRQGDMLAAMAIIRAEQHTRQLPEPYKRETCAFCDDQDILVHCEQNGPRQYCQECLNTMMDMRQMYRYLNVDIETRKQFYNDREVFQAFVRGFLRQWRKISAGMGGGKD